jgi:hypothetical protein
MNAIAQRARAAALSCEAKKHAYRQTQDGVVVSFVLHPQEVPDGLAISALGTRYMLALVEVDENEQPKQPREGIKQTHEMVPDPASWNVATLKAAAISTPIGRHWVNGSRSFKIIAPGSVNRSLSANALHQGMDRQDG